MNTRAVLLSIASGVVFGAAWRGSIPAFFGVLGLGLFFVIQNHLATAHWFRRMTLAWLTGFTAFAIACLWVVDTAEYLLETESKLILLPVAFLVWSVHSFPFVLFAALLRHAQRFANALLIMPPLWLVCELLCPSLFPFPVGCLLLDLPWLAQPAEIGGVSLLSLIAACYALAVPGAYALFTQWREMKTQKTAAKAADRKRAAKELRKGKGKSNGKSKGRVKARWHTTQPAPTRQGWSLVSLLCLGRMGFIPGMLVLIAIWGAVRASYFDGESGEGTSLDLLIVQADTAHERAISRMRGAAAKVAGKADLVLWPECSIGNYQQTLTSFAEDDSVAAAFKGDGSEPNPIGAPSTPLLIGGDSWQGADGNAATQEYVSAYLVDRGGAILGRHDKVSLMPYGESIPGESMFPFLRSWFGSQRVISPGEKITTIGSVSGISLGTVLCCEDMEPELCRRLTQDGAGLLVSLANGVAFKSSVALRQHFRISRCRAIENRRYFVRCASRGVSAVVGPSGAILEELPILEDCAQVVRVRASSTKTLYSQFGMIPVLLVASLMLAAALESAILAELLANFRLRRFPIQPREAESLADAV
ncbi:MAG: apolipoprotein N-acyltransferase [Planctomycetota bacterium]